MPHNEHDFLMRELSDLSPAERDKRLGAINKARAAEERELRPLQESPALIELVKSRMNGSLSRTPEIPLKYGRTPIGESVALTVKGGLVHLVLIDVPTLYVRGAGNHPEMNERVLTDDADSLPLTFDCYVDSRFVSVRRSQLWLFKEAVKAVAYTGKRHAGIQLHT